MANFPKLTSRNEKIDVILSCLAVTCTQAGMLMYTPSFASLSHVMRVDITKINQSLTLYLVGYAFAMLFCGGLSDYLGRKRSYLIAFLAFSSSSLMLGLTNSFCDFLMLRLVQGLAGGACAVVARASTRDIADGKRLTTYMSYISMSFYASLGLFQFLGGIFETYFSYRYGFFLMATFSLLLAVAVGLGYRSENGASRSIVNVRALYRVYCQKFKDKSLTACAVIAGMGYSFIVIFNQVGFHELVDKFQYKPSSLGFIGAEISIFYLVGGLLLSALLKKITPLGLVIISTTFMAVLVSVEMVFYLLNIDSFFIISSILFLQLLQAIMYPSIMTCALERHKDFSGTASSVFGFLQQSTAALIGMIVSLSTASTIYSYLTSNLVIGLVVFLVSGILYIRSISQGSIS